MFGVILHCILVANSVKTGVGLVPSYYIHNLRTLTINSGIVFATCVGYLFIDLTPHPKTHTCSFGYLKHVIGVSSVLSFCLYSYLFCLCVLCHVFIRLERHFSCDAHPPPKKVNKIFYLNFFPSQY